MNAPQRAGQWALTAEQRLAFGTLADQARGSVRRGEDGRFVLDEAARTDLVRLASLLGLYPGSEVVRNSDIGSDTTPQSRAPCGHIHMED